MTDIDAIRKAKRYKAWAIGSMRNHELQPDADVVPAESLDAALAAYDAKCEELAATSREKAAAMGLVEGHALTIAKLEAERDAAVRDAQMYRWLRKGGYPLGPYDDAAIDAAIAALAPPTEQQKVETSEREQKTS